MILYYFLKTKGVLKELALFCFVYSTEDQIRENRIKVKRDFYWT